MIDIVLFHFDRSLWPILFATMQLIELMPWSRSFEDEKGMKEFKFLRTTKENVKKLAQINCCYCFRYGYFSNFFDTNFL